MSPLKKIRKFLNRPYPSPDSYKIEVREIFIAALIVAFFLFAFQPFGLSFYNGSTLLLCLGFGMVTFVIGTAYTFCVRYFLRVYKEGDSWNIKKWIIDLFFMILFIAIGNYLFITYIFNLPLSLSGLLFMTFSTLLVAIIPMVFFGFQNQLRLERLHRKKALEITSNLKTGSENESIVGAVKEPILAIESMQNYIHIYKLIEGNIQKETQRMTLSKAVDEFANHDLQKCHRSYLVNITQVKNVTGNAQGLKLEMMYSDCPIIPVSRAYISIIRNVLN